MTFKNLFNRNGDQLAKEAINDYQKSKDEFEVIKKLQKAIKIGIVNYSLDQIYLYIGASYYDLSIYDKAIEAYEKGLEYNKENHSLLSNLGLTYNQMGEIEKSINFYHASLKIKPDNSYAHHNIGLYNYNKGCHFDAIESLDKAININPGFAVSYALKARCLAYIGLYKEADLVFKEALKKGFDNGPVLKAELENIKNQNPRIFWNSQKFLELLSIFSLDRLTIENLINSKKDPKEFLNLNKELFGDKMLTEFEIKNALQWFLLINELKNVGKILTIDYYSCEPSKIVENIKKILITNDFMTNDTIKEFENNFAYSETEELIFAIASKLKVSNSIELLNIWTSENVLNIYPVEEIKWTSLNYPFIDCENGFGKVYPLATKDTIENFLMKD